MSFTWILNLDAELELARGRPGYVAQRKLLAQLAQHGQSSRALLGPGDVLLTDTAAGASLPPRGRAWCPTPLALESLRARGVVPEPHPDAAVLRRVNHRLFGHELCGGLPGQAYVKTRAELELLLGAYERHWLLKRPLSFAGRGQLRAIGPLTEKQWTWVEASLKRDGLLVEPLVQPLLELSLHGFVWRNGRWQLGRPCTQEVSPRGAFRGVRLAEPHELTAREHDSLTERGATVAEALVRAGYFGPFGIDAYRYVDGANAAFCALGEVNARYTLGFATGFPRPASELSLE